ncbi:hypothetical protein GWI33_007665 [Rhynchophorus ferrugineus]|uniref:Uncharacterized protein n=1 Tax=Rhynchophorus ferrugineus TaxID=354439 RepID=A0A834IJT5_RHYFE|nr:hypothetical protein GWI33_007665 [Rhynchophorus ferrugineus]
MVIKNEKLPYDPPLAHRGNWRVRRFDSTAEDVRDGGRGSGEKMEKGCRSGGARIRQTEDHLYPVLYRDVAFDAEK